MTRTNCWYCTIIRRVVFWVMVPTYIIKAIIEGRRWYEAQHEYTYQAIGKRDGRNRARPGYDPVQGGQAAGGGSG